MTEESYRSYTTTTGETWIWYRYEVGGDLFSVAAPSLSVARRKRDLWLAGTPETEEEAERDYGPRERSEP